MMFVEDLKADFYSVIRGKRVLIVVNYDIDAICACKILQTLFKTDYTLYTLVPVDVSSDLRVLVRENILDEKYIIFINCGGTIDLVEELMPDEDITFFVIDSHRPLDVCNVYNPSQVKLLVKTDADIPQFHDIFSDDEDEENESDNVENDDDEDDDDNDNDVEDVDNLENYDNDHDDNDDNERNGSEKLENQQSKRQRLINKQSGKRQDKKKWEEKRDTLLFNYTKLGYYGRSSALILYELAWKMSKDSFDLLWYAIVGLSEQFLMRKIDEKDYIGECGDVQSHIARLTHRSSQLSDEGRNTAVRIEFEKDLRLALVRHWTVKSSLMYSAFTATCLKLWTFEGEKRLHEMLAEIGIPLIQCNQKFASMDLIFRREFQESLEKMTSKYSLAGITFLSFFMQHGFRAKYSAMDYVYGLMALLQSYNEETPKPNRFLECLEALCRTKKDKLDQGIEFAKRMLTSVFKQVQNALEMEQILSAGPFLYLIIQEANADPTLCNHPYGIFLLAEFALKAYVASSKALKNQQLPLIVSTPCIKEKCHSATPMDEDENDEKEEEEAVCHIAGVAPSNQEKNINFFGKAFRRASENSMSPIQENYFDTAVIKLNVKDRTRFLDALAVLLRQ